MNSSLKRLTEHLERFEAILEASKVRLDRLDNLLIQSECVLGSSQRVLQDSRETLERSKERRQTR
jgi:hypothetical protein